MTKGKTLQDRLARSLDQANKREPKQKLQAPRPVDRRCSKLSISLFSGDLARLNAIRDYMAKRGHRLSTSQVIKLALRSAAISPDMDAALDAIRAEDGRKW